MNKWIHILDRQPNHGQRVMQLYCYGKDDLGREDCTIGTMDYVQNCKFEEVLDVYRQFDLHDPDFWWMPIEDFPFPKKEDKDEVG